MYGHVTKIVRHREAAEIIEAAYNDHVNVHQRATACSQVKLAHMLHMYVTYM